ncbi:MAG: AsmA family protein, partial [Burkholderiales bacterium]
MKPYVKYAVMPLAALLLLTLAVVAIFAATFDPNQYKPLLVQTVKERTGRTLTLDGDIGLAFFPSLGAKIGKASLSEKGSDREFAGVERLHVSVKLLPLLSKQVVVDAVELKGLRANIVKRKEGGTNFDDLTGQTPPPGKDTEPKPAPASPVAIDIAKVEIEDASVRYLDQTTGAQYAVSKLALKTGRLADGVPTAIDLAARMVASAPKIAVDLKVKTKLTFRLGEQRYKLEGLEASLKGAVADISNLNATAKGGVEANLATGELALAKLTVAATGKQAGGDLDVKFEAPTLALTKEKVSGNQLTFEAKLNTAKRKLSARAVIPGVEGSFQSFRTGPLDATVETQEDGRTLKAKLNGAVSGNLEAKRFELPTFAAEVNVNDPKLPKNPIALTVTGAAHADLQKDNAGIEFTGKIDESTFSGRAGIAKFSPLALTFDVAIDKLDADRYLSNTRAKSDTRPGVGSGGKAAPKGGGAAKGGDDKIDLSALRGLNLNGSVKVGEFKLHNLKASQVRADVKLANGRLDVNPLAANLYQGTLAGSLSAQASTTPTFALKQNLNGVNVGPLLRDGANIGTLEGRGTMTLDLTAQGATADALKKALKGTAAVTLVDGSLKGIDLGATVRNAKNAVRQLRGRELLPSAKSEKTDFSEAKGTFNVKNGVAANNDLSIKSPLVRVGGEGTIDIGNDRLDYLVRATVVNTSTGQGGKDAADLKGITVPVKLTGPLGAPQYTVDYTAVAAELARG